MILVLTYFWLNQPIAHDSEEKLLTNFAILKNIFNNNATENTYLTDLIIINTSYSKMLVDYGFNKEMAITDRNELATLFNAISRYNNHNYILCNIMFDMASPSVDVQLKNALVKTKNIVVPQYIDNDSLIKPIFPVNSALVLYLSNMYSNQFSKFRIILSDSLRTIPLCMYENIDNRTIVKKGWFYFDDGKLCLNSNFIDFKVKNVKRATSNKGFTSVKTDDLSYYDLTQFIKFIKHSSKTEMNNFLKDKIILVGSFEKDDIHNTMYGSIPGILILYNIYLNLKENLHVIPISLILILFTVFFILSYRIFYAIPSIKTNFLNKLNKSSLWFLISTLLSYTLLFGLISIITYLLFNIIT